MRRRTGRFCLLLLLAIAAAGCAAAPPELPADALFPATVGEFTRVTGPGVDPESGLDVAVYESPAATLTLYVKQMPEGQAEAALSGLPPDATEVGPDPALGQRQGVFFSFGGEYHAAWGNGDWVFVLSAETDYGRRAFLASYTY